LSVRIYFTFFTFSQRNVFADILKEILKRELLSRLALGLTGAAIEKFA